MAPDDTSEDRDGWLPVDGPTEPDDELVIDRIELLDELTHTTRGALLRQLREPASVAELAEMRDVPITRLYHHVNKLADDGLIRVVATRRSGAATERRYQAAARSFRVGEELVDATDDATLATTLGALFDVAKLSFRREVERGELAPKHGEELMVLSLTELRLSPARQRELTTRLRTVLEEFADDEGEEDYVLFVSGFPTTG